MYDTVIIGAGIGGLTCGAVLAKAGKKVLIIERHTRPGGYVTSYSRDGFIFDVPHVISGLREGASPLWKIIREIGVNIEFIELEPYQKVIYPEHEIRVYTDIEKYKQELKAVFPQDSEGIDRFYETLSKLNEEMKRLPEDFGILDLLSFPFKFPTVYRYMNAVFEGLLNDHLKNPKLKAILASAQGYVGSPPSKVSALYYAGMLISFHYGGAWYPKGGYQKMADAFAKAFEARGGELLLNTEVKKIIIEKGKAQGVELSDGRIIKCALVVSNADTKRTFLDLVGEENLKKNFAHRIRNAELSSTGFAVHLGVKMELEKMDLNYGTIFVKTNGNVFLPNGKSSINSIGISIPSLHDKSLAPEGCHSMDILLIPAPYDFNNKWLSDNGKRTDAYKKLKEEMADKLIKTAELLIPDLSRNIVVKDITTPLTYERYTRASEGCWYDLAQIPSQFGVNRLASKKIIKNLLFTGSKSLYGGIYGATTCGYQTAKRILK
ncbi:MAG: NAD(P)/FAD-dependent oxidoreductase [Euryarchaeota archaeon]|nr:NAD(P)/FAD-dependent oxidoreductase [Euryarchaeota archaeon]MCG2728621.1 NAD(P)/FAD-dependent oxidoreductase [Candidatus Methanoperedenaceae archaeon]